MRPALSEFTICVRRKAAAGSVASCVAALVAVSPRQHAPWRAAEGADAPSRRAQA